MAKDIQIKYKNEQQEWEELYPKTKTRNLTNDKGESQEEINENLTSQLTHTEGEISERGFNLDNLVGEDRIITQAIWNEAVASDQEVIFLKRGQTYFIHETITVGHNTLEGNRATIVAKNCDAFHVDNGDYLEIIPKMQNLTLRYEGSGKHTGILVDRGWWGSRARLENIRVHDFSIGIHGKGAYHCTFRDIWITGSDIGLAFTDNLEISNMNDVSQVDFRDCTYGMYVHETETMRIFSATFQECVYGLVIGDARGNVEFDNCYYEANEYNTALGEINLETFELFEYNLGVGGVFGAGVNFSGATVSVANSPDYFFGENHKFMSRYGNFSTNHYPDNIANLMSSGIEYVNILQDRWGIYKDPTDTGVTTIKLENTPYGEKYVSQVDNATGKNFRMIANIMTPVVIGRSYLIKAKVWTTDPMRLQFHFLRDHNESIITGRNFDTVKGGWVDVSTMITVGQGHGGVGETQQLMIKFPTITDTSKIMLTDVMVVDLTDIFGSVDDTPGHYVRPDIAHYFSWAPNNQRMKTGHASVVTSSFTTANRPKHAKKGDTGFDTTLSKPIWCSVGVVLDTVGEITSPPVWVDSTGTTV